MVVETIYGNFRQKAIYYSPQELIITQGYLEILEKLPSQGTDIYSLVLQKVQTFRIINLNA